MSSRSRALIGLAAVLTVVYFIAPSSGAAEAIRILSPAIAVGAIVVGIAGFRPPHQAAMGADRTVDGAARRRRTWCGPCSSSGATTRSRRPATRSASCRPWRSLSVCRSSRVTRGRRRRARRDRGGDRGDCRRARRLARRRRAVSLGRRPRCRRPDLGDARAHARSSGRRDGFSDGDPVAVPFGSTDVDDDRRCAARGRRRPAHRRGTRRRLRRGRLRGGVDHPGVACSSAPPHSIPR